MSSKVYYSIFGIRLYISLNLLKLSLCAYDLAYITNAGNNMGNTVALGLRVQESLVSPSCSRSRVGPAGPPNKTLVVS